MRFTNLSILDPLMSIAVAAFILFHAGKNLLATTDLFLEKTPKGIDVAELTAHLSAVEGVTDIHHLHIRSLDGARHSATMHIRCHGDGHRIKEQIRQELAEHDIYHATLELEAEDEHCHNPGCDLHTLETAPHTHHHHHH
jgi:cobalt-zinc-cadmium efflux system protein